MESTQNPISANQKEQPDNAMLERVLLAALNEQRRSRCWRNGWRIVWCVIILIVLGFIFFKENSTRNIEGPHTALIRIDGEISANSPASAENIVVSLNAAFEDKGTKAVVLLINSPGGSPVQAGIVYDEIRRLEGKYKIPVYAVAEDICASGAYYIAAAANKIFVNKASMVGSIGVIMDGFNFTDLIKKIGIERRVLTAGRNKNLMDPFSKQSPEQTEQLQSMLNEVHQQFIDAVVLGRGKRLKITKDTFSGLIWTGQDAIAMGLADNLGSLDYVARDIVKAPEILDYTQTENMAMRLVKRLGVSIGSGVVLEAARIPSLK
jgi:protease IV